MEGIEVYDDDLKYQKDKSVMYVSSNGEDYDGFSGFKQYEMLHEIGSGGFGRVVLGKHRLSREKVAIKIVNTQSSGTAEDIDMVFREADTLRQLKHRNIVKVLNQYTLPNMRVVFVMEYCSGGELLQYLECN